MRNRLIVIACSLFASCSTFAAELPRGNPEEVGMSSERLQKIDDVIQEYIDADRVQGVVVGVTRRNTVVYYEAHGVIDSVRKTPMPKDTLFAMASSTKPILGVAAMMLIEEGIISPDDPVEKYLPEFKGIQVAVPVNPESKNKSKDKSKKKAKGGKDEAKKYDEEWLKENWDNLSEEDTGGRNSVLPELKEEPGAGRDQTCASQSPDNHSRSVDSHSRSAYRRTGVSCFETGGKHDRYPREFYSQGSRGLRWIFSRVRNGPIAVLLAWMSWHELSKLRQGHRLTSLSRHAYLTHWI